MTSCFDSEAIHRRAAALGLAGRENFASERMGVGQPRVPNQSPEPTRMSARHANVALGPRGSS